MNNVEFNPLLLIPLFIILLAQGSWIFYDASKRGENKWLWGFFGLLNSPSNLIIYLIVTRIILKSKPCYSCGKWERENSHFCSNCGEKLK